MTETAANKAATPEEVERWISNFKNYCEAQQITIADENKEFIALERAYWLGLVAGRGAECIPSDLAILLFAHRSPLLEHKDPAKKRIRRTKAELEAASRVVGGVPAASPAEIPEAPTA